MKKMILLAALATGVGRRGGRPPRHGPDAIKAAPEATKPAAKAAKMAKKRQPSLSKRHQDARHCLQRTNNDAIIRCAEEYL